MHPADCPRWEYQDNPQHKQILKGEVAGVLVDLRRRSMDTRRCARDTRPIHARLFRSLVPKGHECYAGHFRGEDFRCLKYCQVGIQNDPRVGASPSVVLSRMKDLSQLVGALLAGLDEAHRLPDGQLSPEDKLLYTVIAACRAFELFLRIHPYVNGNGHMARFCIWAILGRYSYWPAKWPVEPRPPDPPYTNLLLLYRNGTHEPLEQYVLQCVAG